VQAVLRHEGISLGESGEMELSVKMCDLASKNDLDGLRLMVLNGCDVGNGDYDMRTPLHLAASNEMLACLEYMLKIEPNINVNPIDRFGGTPLEDAYRHNNSTAIHLLEHWGGLRKDDPSQGDALEGQKALIKANAKKQRIPLVEAKSKECHEQMAMNYLQGQYTQELQSKMADLQAAFDEITQRLHKLVQDMMPYHPGGSMKELQGLANHSIAKQDIVLERIQSVEITESEADAPKAVPAAGIAALQSGWSDAVSGNESSSARDTETADIPRMPSNLLPGRLKSAENEAQGLTAQLPPTISENPEDSQKILSDTVEGVKSSPMLPAAEGYDAPNIPRLESYMAKPENQPDAIEIDSSSSEIVKSGPEGKPLRSVQVEHVARFSNSDGVEAAVEESKTLADKQPLSLFAVMDTKRKFKEAGQSQSKLFSNTLADAETIRTQLTELKTKIMSLRKCVEPDTSWTPKFATTSTEDDKQSWDCKAWRMATIQLKEHSQLLKKRLQVQMDLYKLLRRLLRELIRVTQRKLRSSESSTNFAVI